MRGLPHYSWHLVLPALSEFGFGVLDPQTHHVLINKVSYTVCFLNVDSVFFPDVVAALAHGI